MKNILSKVVVNDVKSPFHERVMDIEIEGGKITKISENIQGDHRTDLSGLVLSPSFVDLFAHFNEPGKEYKEDLYSGCHSAAFGGFTDVCLIPNTTPVVQKKSDISFLKSKSGMGVSLHPIAALSEECEGQNLTEILDLNSAGAIAFSDGLNPIWNTELLLKALQYVQKFNGVVINRPKDIHLSQFSHMHEGVTSTVIGLKGEPSISEEITVKRDLDILRYAGGRLHFTHLSTSEGVGLVKAAKEEGLSVTCDVALNQLLYTDKELEGYDTNYKVDPPFRLEKDRQALINGLKEGVIDAIVSSHQPQDSESKDLEFDLSSPGLITLPVVYSTLLSISLELPIDVALNKFSQGPRRVMGLPEVTIEVGSPARFTLLDPNRKWTFDKKSNPSKSINSPLYGKELTGFCHGIFDGKRLHLNKVKTND